jgi:Concanavalin A-like lectin/glucanases superfamily
MTRTLRLPLVLAASLLCLCASRAAAQSFRVSFDTGLKADRALGRAEPWVSRNVDLVAGRFGKAAQIGPRGQLIYAAEQNVQAGRGTLACWCRIPKRPGPLDVQRIVFVQSKERGYWTYLATMEWQESVFRAMAFDFYHGHGWHDPSGLPALTAGAWHHVALVWDQAEGTKFYLDGKLIGSTWGKQAWWERPTPHAIHLSWPGAIYDELCIYDQVLSDKEVAALARDNRFEVPRKAEPPGSAAAARLLKSVAPVGLQHLPAVDVGTKPTVIRQARVGQILDDRIPAWKVMDGRMNLFWPEWRAPVLGDVDFSGSELSVALEPGQKPTHLLLRGLVGGCRVHGERGGYVSRAPILQVPPGLHFLGSGKLPAGLTGLRLPRHEGMKLQEIGLFEVGHDVTGRPPGTIVTPLTGAVELDTLRQLAVEIRTRTLSHERTVLGKAARPTRQACPVAPLSRVHLLTEPVTEALPLDAVELKLRFSAPWKEDIWWLRIQDPVNPRRDLLNVPVRVVNPTLGKEATFHVVLDFWDVVLDPQSRLWVELLPAQGLTLMTGESSQVALWPGERAKALAEFAHTQSQIAYSYWQLGSEAGGTSGSDPNAPGFALLGTITHNRELKLTLEWVRRHVPDHRLTNKLWAITHGKRRKVPVKPHLQPPGAPEWAVWGRELLERFRRMSHHWADRQGPDGQIGGGWNDDSDFPGVFLCLPLLGDTKTQRMFVRIFDGIEHTGYLRHGVSRGPTDALHATDFLSWRAHLMLFDYGQPRHVERALRLTRELDLWTKVDGKGHRRFVSTYFSEDGPGWRPGTEIDSAGLIQELHADGEGGASRNFLRDPLFCAWYSRNPAVLKFVREMAEGDYARVTATKKAGAYESYPFYSYFTLFGDPKFIDEPVGRFLRDRWSLPIWRRFAERLPDGKRLDAALLKQARAATASDELLTTGYLISRDPAFLVRALRNACEELEGGWQFRGGEAGGANDHFYVPGQAALSQMYLGSALTWLRPASIVPPLAVSWQGLDTDTAACVRAATPQSLSVAAYNFAEKPRKVRMRVWELSPGQYRLRQGTVDGNEQFVGTPATRELALVRGSFIDLELPPRKVYVIELKQLKARPHPELLPDLAVGDGDIYYDKATDRLKVVVHNIGAAAAKDVTVRFEGPEGKVLLERTIARLDAPLDLRPKTAVVWMPQPLLHPVDRISVRIDPEGRIDEITRENNSIAWVPGP